MPGDTFRKSGPYVEPRAGVGGHQVGGVDLTDNVLKLVVRAPEERGPGNVSVRKQQYARLGGKVSRR
jgi:hypothetical protein